MRRFKGRAWTFLRLIAAAGIGWLIIRGAGEALRLEDGLRWDALQAAPALIALSFPLLFVNFGVSCWIWRGLVVALGGPRIPLGAAASVVLCANLGKYVPGKVAQIAGLAALGARVGIPGIVSVPAGLLGQLVQISAAVAVGGAWMMEWLKGDATAFFVLAALIGLAAALLALGWPQRALAWVLEKQGRELSLPSVRSGPLLLWLAASVLNWAVMGCALWTLAFGFGLQVSFLSMTTAFAAAYAAGYLVLLAPGGLGVRESTLAALLAPALGSSGILFAGIARAWITAGELLGAGLGGFLLRAYPKASAGANR